MLAVPLTTENKPIKSDKEFEKEVGDLCVKLKDT